MQLVYVIAQGHTGSTLLDCILGTHPGFVSSGELRYLNWQLLRTQGVKASVKAQNICTCEEDFRDCAYWSQVFTDLKNKTGSDIVANPLSFDTAYFNQFSYQNRGGKKPSYLDKIKAFLVREWLEKGYSHKTMQYLEPKLKTWLRNNWTLYQSMAHVANKPVVVDSSKHLTIALLLQQYQPEQVSLLFLHRSAEGFVASRKKWAKKRNKPFNLHQTIAEKDKFEKRVEKYKKNIPNLRFLDIEYEHLAESPATVINKVAAHVNLKPPIGQSNEAFYINPSEQHIVAGNPMRYRGKQQVMYDDRWKKELTDDELQHIKAYQDHAK